MEAMKHLILTLMATTLLTSCGEFQAFDTGGLASRLGDPKAPSGLSTKVMSCSQIDLSWNTPDSDQFPNLKSFKVYRDGLFLLATTANSLSDQNLVEDSTYSYQISAVNQAGEESPKTPVATAQTSVCSQNPPPVKGPLQANTNYPTWLKFSNGTPHFLCGAGDPEDFLYRGSRNSNGTRNGDQMALINKMKQTGANGIYMQIVRSHGGDGPGDHNPFNNSNPSSGLDTDILNQWETWFREMDQAGIVIYLFFYDDSSCIWGCNKGSDNSSPSAEQNFIKAIVNRFSHHNNLVWVIAEEYQERFSAARADSMARVIKETDSKNHPVALHQLSGLNMDLPSSPYVDQFSIQIDGSSAQDFHQKMVSAWNSANGRYNLNLAEPAGGSVGTGVNARRIIWASAMGGAYIMPIDWDIVSTPNERLKECGYLAQFFESIRLETLSPHDELIAGNSQYVLADPGSHLFVAYGSNATSNLGIKGALSGTYNLVWMDTVSGQRVSQQFSHSSTGNALFPKPANLGNEVVVYAERVVTSPANQVFPGASWEKRSASDHCQIPTKLDQFAANVGGVGVIVKNGYIVKEWGAANSRGDWASSSKPVMSTLLFFAIQEDKLSSPNDKVVNLGWNLSGKDRDIQYHHLANMISGYMRAEAPGTAWAYNDYAIQLYAESLKKVYGGGSLNSIATNSGRLGVLQFQDGSIFGSRGGNGLETSPRDFARIGWFWLNEGKWQGQQVLNKSFFQNFRKAHVAGNLPRTGGTDSRGDYLGIGTHGGGTDQTHIGPGIYGYNWWFNPGQSVWPDAPPDAFQANGHWSKEVMTVIPSLNMVVAARGSWGAFEPGNRSAGMNQNLKLLSEACP